MVHKKNTSRSILALVAGFMSVALLSMATDFFLEKIGVFPPQSEPDSYTTYMLLWALLYRSFYTTVGGYLTASLAPINSLRHAILLGIVGTIAGTLGAIANWNLGNHWYPVAIVVLGLPCTYLGGIIYLKKENH
jgi:hypothetical protein